MCHHLIGKRPVHGNKKGNCHQYILKLFMIDHSESRQEQKSKASGVIVIQEYLEAIRLKFEIIRQKSLC
jgi:hypothetical protein